MVIARMRKMREEGEAIKMLLLISVKYNRDSLFSVAK